MSVQNQTVKNVYDGNGSATVFPFTFALNEDDGEHVGVYVTNDAGTSESTDNFTIDAEAKTVTYPKVGDPLPVGKKIVIRREIPNEQDLNLENLGPFFAEDIEGELDKEVMMIQQLAEEVNRAVKVDMASDRTPDEFMQDIADAVEQAKDYADEASDSADDADASATKAATWAEGADADVSALGGTHSAKGWADESHTYANESEIWDEGSDVEVQALGGQHSAQTYAYQAGESVTAAAGEVTKASKWAEGSDADVSPLGGTHSAKGWAADAEASATSVITNVDKAQKWAEGSDADVTPLGGEHSSKGWSDQAKAWAMSMANLPVASIVPWGGTANTPPVGFLFCDGSAVSRTMYPDLFAAIGTTYGAGDGSTTFNVPDLTGGEFLEGSDTAGTSHAAGLPNVEGTLNVTNYSTGPSPLSTGAFEYVGLGNGVAKSSTGSNTNEFSFDASRSSVIYGASNTVQPKSLTVRFVIKAFDGQTPDSALIDITQYAADLANKATRSLDNLNATGEDHFLEQDFTIIYPNGGSEGSPANVLTNSRYVETNPFAGYLVYCIAEVYYNSKWGVTGWGTSYTDGKGYGVSCSQFDDDSIVIQTGNGYVMTSSNNIGNPFNESVALSSLPCRVKVWKIGKVASA